MNTAVVSAAMIYMLLKQYYSDKGSIPKKLAQSVCVSGFQRFSHVPYVCVWCIYTCVLMCVHVYKCVYMCVRVCTCVYPCVCIHVFVFVVSLCLNMLK